MFKPFTTITPAPHKRLSCSNDVKAVTVWFDSDVYHVVNKPKAVYVGRKSITVQGRTPQDTVRLTGESGVVEFRLNDGRVITA